MFLILSTNLIRNSWKRTMNETRPGSAGISTESKWMASGKMPKVCVAKGWQAIRASPSDTRESKYQVEKETPDRVRPLVQAPRFLFTSCPRGILFKERARNNLGPSSWKTLFSFRNPGRILVHTKLIFVYIPSSCSVSSRFSLTPGTIDVINFLEDVIPLRWSPAIILRGENQ